MIIGTDTTYLGDEIFALRGQKVRIIAVLRGSLREDADPEADGYFVNDNATLARLGGVTAEDRIDAAAIRADGTVSFVSYDPRAVDLECFAHLRSPTEQ